MSANENPGPQDGLPPAEVMQEFRRLRKELSGLDDPDDFDPTKRARLDQLVRQYHLCDEVGLEGAPEPAAGQGGGKSAAGGDGNDLLALVVEEMIAAKEGDAAPAADGESDWEESPEDD